MVVDDHRLLAEALASALKLRGHRVLAAAAPAAGAAELVITRAPEVCLLGTATPAEPGIFDPVVRIKRERPQVAVLVLGPVPEPARHRGGLRRRRLRLRTPRRAHRGRRAGHHEGPGGRGGGGPATAAGRLQRTAQPRRPAGRRGPAAAADAHPARGRGPGPGRRRRGHPPDRGGHGHRPVHGPHARPAGADEAGRGLPAGGGGAGGAHGAAGPGGAGAAPVAGGRCGGRRVRRRPADWVRAPRRRG